MENTLVFRARGESRFIPGRHFILSDINAALVKKCGLNISVSAFKEIVRRAEPAFTTHTGNRKKAPLMKVNVYDINDFKKL